MQMDGVCAGMGTRTRADCKRRRTVDGRRRDHLDSLLRPDSHIVRYIKWESMPKCAFRQGFMVDTLLCHPPFCGVHAQISSCLAALRFSNGIRGRRAGRSRQKITPLASDCFRCAAVGMADAFRFLLSLLLHDD